MPKAETLRFLLNACADDNAVWPQMARIASQAITSLETVERIASEAIDALVRKKGQSPWLPERLRKMRRN